MRSLAKVDFILIKLAIDRHNLIMQFAVWLIARNQYESCFPFYSASRYRESYKSIKIVNFLQLNNVFLFIVSFYSITNIDQVDYTEIKNRVYFFVTYFLPINESKNCWQAIILMVVQDL